MKFSRIDFTDEPIDAPAAAELRRESVGCIQLKVEKSFDVYKTHVDVSTSSTAAADTSSLKIWEQDEMIAGKLSVATRFAYHRLIAL
jgi:hypothetical protein